MSMPSFSERCWVRSRICVIASPRFIGTWTRCLSACSNSRTCSNCRGHRSRCSSGEIDNRQTEILAQRISVAILVPRLKKRVAESRQRVVECQNFLEKLEAVRPNAGLSEKVYSALAAEYKAGLESATTSVRCSEEEVASWRVRGRHVLAANQKLAARGAGDGNGARNGRAASRVTRPANCSRVSVVSCGARKLHSGWWLSSSRTSGEFSKPVTRFDVTIRRCRR